MLIFRLNYFWYLKLIPYFYTIKLKQNTMKLQDIKLKADMLKAALSGCRTKVDSISIDLDKEAFKALHLEAGEPKIYEPEQGINQYWFGLQFDELRVYINYHAKAITTYETL
jgi:hypothetical protein